MATYRSEGLRQSTGTKFFPAGESAEFNNDSNDLNDLKKEPESSSGIQGIQGSHGLQGVRNPPDGEAKLVLNAEQKAALRARTSRGLARAVVAQCVMAILATVGAWVVAGTAAGLSALVGAGAYLVPNALFALRLLLGAYRPGSTNPFTFFLGEAFKLVATVLLLWLAVHLGGDRIVWPAMLIGLICALKGYVLLLMFGKLS